MAAVTLTAEQAESVTDRAVLRATAIAEEMADISCPAAVKREHNRIARFVELLDEIERGAVTDLTLVRDLVAEVTGEVLDEVAYDRAALEKLRGGDMGYCCDGLTVGESERQSLDHITRREADAVVAHQVLDLLDGEGSVMAASTMTATEWDAHFELWLGSAIGRQLQADPPPEGSAIAGDARRWAENLAAAGRRRLVAVGSRHLQLISGEGAG